MPPKRQHTRSKKYVPPPSTDKATDYVELSNGDYVELSSRNLIIKTRFETIEQFEARVTRARENANHVEKWYRDPDSVRYWGVLRCVKRCSGEEWYWVTEHCLADIQEIRSDLCEKWVDFIALL